MKNESVKRLIRQIRHFSAKKGDAELSYWRGRFEEDNGQFRNSHYEPRMLEMSGEASDEFLQGKVVADFGCGPRGSLSWAESAQLRIGIDVLAERYVEEFTDSVLSHGMVYLKSTENVIPLPSDFVDVLFTLNAIDHVDSFATMCDEMLRILKPGGEFIGSFNLHEPASRCEPQHLTEDLVNETLLSKMLVRSCRTAERGPAEDVYGPITKGGTYCPTGREGFLWVRATKP